MVVLRVLRAHLDAMVALVLAAAYLVEVALESGADTSDPLVEGLAPSASMVIAVGTTMLLSLALRVRWPLVPLALTFVVLGLAGRGPLDASWVLLAGGLLAVYSTGAWAGGRAGQIGALAVGALIGVAVLRTAADGSTPREVAVPAFLFVGAWLAGMTARTLRAGRGDRRVLGRLEWEASAATPDSAGRDETVRELRDTVERAMSTIVLQAREARRAQGQPSVVQRSLALIEAAGSEALEETQRLTGLLLSPDGTPLPEPRPGLADLEYLADEVSHAGLPVSTRVEGQPVPLSPELDAAAYQVVSEALLGTLQHSRDARADVVVRYLRDELQVEVTDDGLASGGDAAAETAGLVAARAEVAAIGGTLDAGPQEDRGYWVLARLPYEPDWD